jgi:serine/threonine protein kinase/outer membrane protein assembly factor BamB
MDSIRIRARSHNEDEVGRMRQLSDTDPSSIGPYRLTAILGTGGMGRVYLGESRSGRQVAIKVVRSDLAEDPAFRRRFAREVSAAKAVNPLFSAAVVDADPDAKEPWFASTYIDGPSLASRVGTSGPLAPVAVLVLAAGLADGLASIHRAGLVHRDLKPSNVIITDQGPHIIDFGIALAADSNGATTSRLLGTPSYIAPERIHGSEANPASDIFSLGATLAYAATGHPLVDEGPVYAQLMQITTGRFDLDSVPAELRPLVTRCVSPRAKDRPTADELSRILGASGIPKPRPGWYDAQDTGPTVPVVVPPPPGLTRRRLLLAGSAAGALVATSGAAAILVPTSPPGHVTRRPDGTTPTTSTPPPPAPPQPGEVIWQLDSGAAALGLSSGTHSAGGRILVDARTVVAATGSDVVAIRPDQSPGWRAGLSSGLVALRRWGPDILVNDARRLWLLDSNTGTPRFVANIVEAEEKIVGSGKVIEIGEIAVAPDRVFVSLGTSTVAIGRTGLTEWRLARPGGPAAADAKWVLMHDVRADAVEVSLRSARTSAAQWTIQYPPPDPVNGAPPGGGPPPPGGDPPGGGPDRDGPGSDEDWYRNEGFLTSSYALLRESSNIRLLDLANGNTRWKRTSPTPVIGVQIIGDLVMIGADRINALSLGGGSQQWQVPDGGARCAGSPDGRVIVAASDNAVTAFDAGGAARWRTDVPGEFADGRVGGITVDEHTAYVTFKPLDERRGPLGVDVLAIALDAKAVRP